MYCKSRRGPGLALALARRPQRRLISEHQRQVTAGSRPGAAGSAQRAAAEDLADSDTPASDRAEPAEATGRLGPTRRGQACRREALREGT